jgi:hypothetical protein
VGIQLTSPGIPCIYYGTEQALDGNEEYHDYSIEAQRFGEDRYVREDMFGGPFGAFQTTGCHFFNPEHPTYKRIAAIARVRNRPDAIGRTLRLGICFPRETSFCGYPFRFPGAGELFAWSMVLPYREVVMVLNTNGLEERGAHITVDAKIHSPGTQLQVLYRADWSDHQLDNPPTDESFTVEATPEGRAYLNISLPPAGMLILA